MAARHAANLTQKQSADLVYAGLRTWQQWEAGDRKMPMASWVLFRLRVKQITLDDLSN